MIHRGREVGNLFLRKRKLLLHFSGHILHELFIAIILGTQSQAATTPTLRSRNEEDTRVGAYQERENGRWLTLPLDGPRSSSLPALPRHACAPDPERLQPPSDINPIILIQWPTTPLGGLVGNGYNGLGQTRFGNILETACRYRVDDALSKL